MRILLGPLGAIFGTLLVPALTAAEARPDAVSFSKPAILNSDAARHAAEDSNPQVATDGTGAWVAVWHSTEGFRYQVRRDADIYWARSLDGGASWSEPQALNRGAADDTGSDTVPTIAVGAGGLWVTAWTSNGNLGGELGTDRDILYATSTDAGTSWGEPLPLHGNAAHDWGDDENPALATDGKGTWIAVWQSADSLENTIGGDRDVLFTVSSDNARTWSAVRALNTNAATDAGFDISPHIATDKSGAWVVVWSSDDVLDGSIGTDRDILHARSTDNGGSWSEPRMLAPNATRDLGADWEPTVASDGRGSWVALWSSADTLDDTIDRDRDILFVRSTDAGATWIGPRPLNANAHADSGDDSAPAIVWDGSGIWAVVWQSWDRLDGTKGADADILVGLSSDGGETWTGPAPLHAIATSDVGEDVMPDLASDGQGHWVCVWRSNEPRDGKLGTDPDIFVASGGVAASPAPSAAAGAGRTGP